MTSTASDHAAAWAAYNSSYGTYASYPQYSAYSGAYASPAWGVTSASGNPPLPALSQELSPNATQETSAPPLPPDDGPPGASSSDVSAQTAAPTQGSAPSAPMTSQPASMYDYQQYYNAYYHGYGAYSHDGAHASFPHAYPPANTPKTSLVHTYAFPATHAYTPTAATSATQDYTAHAAAGHHTVSASALTPSVPKPKPPPGNPPACATTTSAAPIRPKSAQATYTPAPPPSTLPANSFRNHTFGTRPKAASAQVNTSSAAASEFQHTAKPTPAFVKVGSLSASQSSAATPTAKPAGSGGGGFPPSFNKWVEKCFAFCRSDAERQTMTARLTEKIKSAQAQDRMWLIDWVQEPVPSVSSVPAGPSAISESNTSLTAGVEGSGLRSKRSRWEEVQQTAQPVAQPLKSKGKHNNKQYEKQQQQQHHRNQGWAGKANKKAKHQYDDGGWTHAETSRLAQRADRFGKGPVLGATGGSASDESDFDEAFLATREAAVVGTSTALEKSYFRLTAPPDPREVRPPGVLRRALDRLVRMLREGDTQATPFYAVDQFKGLRQDCTVQHLRTELTVDIYEAHARQSLEYGDLAEFNQCQTQLAALYADGIPGCVAEFTAYKLLYNLVHASSGANRALLHTLRVTLSQLQGVRNGNAGGASQPSHEADPLVNALAAREAFATDNYPAFFRAYAAAPNLGRAILDVLAPQVRWAALNVLVKTYKTSLPLAFVARALGFVVSAVSTASARRDISSSPPLLPATGMGKVHMAGCRQPEYVGKAVAAALEAEGITACAAWLRTHGAVLEESAGGGGGDVSLDVKASMGQLFVPEEASKVAHGDENLSLDDFLARASGLKK